MGLDIYTMQGDCLEMMRELPDASVDSVVTDPPYGLTFMGKAWDKGVPGVEVWREALRVLKPGGHLLAFAGTRTQHRMACAIEDAGFEIRDMIAWAYGSGFPKSHNVQQAINKAARGAPQGGADPKSPNHGKFKGGCSDDNPSGRGFGAGAGALMAEKSKGRKDDDGEWQGWGTALKPALEPITVARKPLDGTVAKNVLEHGTGALNIDGCRIDGGARPLREGDYKAEANGAVYAGRQKAGRGFDGGSKAAGETTEGRWPANLIHDGSDEVLACFPDSKGQQGDVRGTEPSKPTQDIYGQFSGRVATAKRNDTGSAARFFYCAKASKKDRQEGNKHPTIKPTDLMRYLCRLVTPPGGTVLDPFMGSGSTGKACGLEGFSFIGIEKEPEYFATAEARIDAAYGIES